MHFENQIKYKDQLIYYDQDFRINIYSHKDGLIQVVFNDLHEVKKFIDELTDNKLTNK